MQKRELPLGFGMALAQNEPAMRAFEALPESEKDAVIQKSHAVSSKGEMARLVSGLTEK
ncbi:MAG: hypothetical protein ACI3VZ_02150 [Faecousia sp.]